MTRTTRRPIPGVRLPILLVALLFAALTAAAPATAHEADPDYDSVIRTVRNAPKGLDVQVLNGGDRLLVRNDTGREIDIPGYQQEPYVRMRPDGTVQVNTRSPSWFVNQDPDGETQVPASADSDAPPQWRTVDENGRFEFHDHRIHWMGKSRAPQVKDVHRRTKVFDWDVPLKAGGRPVAVLGTLTWVGRPSDSFPVAALVALVVVVLAAVALVLVVRRRRSAGGPGGDDGGAGGDGAPSTGGAW